VVIIHHLLISQVVASCQLNRYTSAMTPTQIEKERSLRADAEQNRERIVEAARELFAERGIDVTREEIAAGPESVWPPSASISDPIRPPRGCF